MALVVLLPTYSLMTAATLSIPWSTRGSEQLMEFVGGGMLFALPVS
jgi:hypothetical protein